MPPLQPSPAKKGRATALSHGIAEKLENLRNARQISQRQMAEHLDVSFQQYQKYEKGKDRISLERALVLCRALNVPLDIFNGQEQSFGFAESEQASFGDGSAKTLTDQEQELLAIFRAIPKKSQKIVLETVRQMGKMGR